MPSGLPTTRPDTCCSLPLSLSLSLPRTQVLLRAQRLHVYGSGTFGAFWTIKPARVTTANLRTKILDFRGSDSSRILISRGGILRKSCGSLASTNLGRDDLSREIGRMRRPRRQSALGGGTGPQEDLQRQKTIWPKVLAEWGLYIPSLIKGPSRVGLASLRAHQKKETERVISYHIIVK